MTLRASILFVVVAIGSGARTGPTQVTREDAVVVLKANVRDAQLYVDGDRPDAKFNADFQERMTGITAQPYYLLLDPNTEEILGRFEGFANTHGLIAEFIGEVKKVADQWDAGGA